MDSRSCQGGKERPGGIVVESDEQTWYRRRRTEEQSHSGSKLSLPKFEGISNGLGEAERVVGETSSTKGTQ